MTLLKSKYNLESSTISFLENNETITLFSAYIRTEQLRKINQTQNINQIVVRWQVGDICFGASDLELYGYCRDNNIKLFRNTKIHLKAFWNNKRSVLFGSANVTKNGIGEGGNLELNGTHDDISHSDIMYFNEIIASSTYITEELYNEIKGKVAEHKDKVVRIPDLPNKKAEADFFLLSQLPMSLNVSDLYNTSVNSDSLSDEDLNCLIHDIVLYEVSTNLSEDDFYSELKNSFNSHPFIIELKEVIKSDTRQSLSYGGVVRWIQDKTTTVPTPRSWELKEEQIINILYEWICFCDVEFIWNRPKWTQIIKYDVNNEWLSETDFLNQLNRDQASGFKKPHQIILLMILFDLYIKKQFSFSVDEIEEKFNLKWNSFLIRNSILNSIQHFGLPLKAFFNSGLLQFAIEGQINDRTWRTKSEIKEKINSIGFSYILLMIFDQIEDGNILEDYLE